MHYIPFGDGRKSGVHLPSFCPGRCLVALLGIGTFTSSQLDYRIRPEYNDYFTSYYSSRLSVFVAIAVFGGLKSISKVSTAVVPFMAIIYILGTLTVIFFNIGKIPATIALILTSAFSPVAAVGGFAGASIRMAIQNGVRVVSSQTNLVWVLLPIAAAAAKTNEPVEQGLISMTGTFIDTLIICTLTGLTILVTGVWSGDLNGVALTQSAFSTVFSHFGPALLTIFLVLFAFYNDSRLELLWRTLF